MKSGAPCRGDVLLVLGGILCTWTAGCSARVVGPQAETPAVIAPSPAAPAPSAASFPEDGTYPPSASKEPGAVGEETSEETDGVARTPVLFEGRDQVTYSEFIDELRRIADRQADDPDVRAAHQRLLTDKGLSEDELPLVSFSRARLAFESARDSGLWGIRGTITDQMPWSDRVWEQWGARSFSAEAPLATAEIRAYPTAVAECDEMGALFSILARDMGVIGFVGLHWPYWNHVVPVWQVDKKDGTFVRIVVPATQTFLDKRDTIGTTGLKTNRVVFPYVRKDRKDDTLLSADLARFLLTQSERYGGLSTEELTEKRLWHRLNHRPGAPAPELEPPTPQANAQLESSSQERRQN